MKRGLRSFLPIFEITLFLILVLPAVSNAGFDLSTNLYLFGRNVVTEDSSSTVSSIVTKNNYREHSSLWRFKSKGSWILYYGENSENVITDDLFRYNKTYYFEFSKWVNPYFSKDVNTIVSKFLHEGEMKQTIGMLAEPWTNAFFQLGLSTKEHFPRSVIVAERGITIAIDYLFVQDRYKVVLESEFFHNFDTFSFDVLGEFTYILFKNINMNGSLIFEKKDTYRLDNSVLIGFGYTWNKDMK